MARKSLVIPHRQQETLDTSVSYSDSEPKVWPSPHARKRWQIKVYAQTCITCFALWLILSANTTVSAQHVTAGWDQDRLQELIDRIRAVRAVERFQAETEAKLQAATPQGMEARAEQARRDLAKATRESQLWAELTNPNTTPERKAQVEREIKAGLNEMEERTKAMKAETDALVKREEKLMSDLKSPGISRERQIQLLEEHCGKDFVRKILAKEHLLMSRQSPMRLWTDRSGTNRTIAVFVAFANGKLRLKKENGELLGLGLDKLSSPDQTWVKQKLALRSWKDASGTFSIKARLQQYVDGAVTLGKEDGRVIRVEVDKLSAEDQAFVDEP